MTVTALLVLCVGYLLGCVSTGYYLTRLATGQDVRTLGSGATGGSNVGRVLGRKGFALTMAGDALKGAAAVGVGLYLGLAAWVLMGTALAAVIGHIFPAQLGFRGGKGLATALGALLVFDWRLPVILLPLIALAWLLSRQMTFSLVGGLLIAPLVALVIGHPPAVAAGLALMAALLLYAHRPNIRAAWVRARQRPGPTG